MSSLTICLLVHENTPLLQRVLESVAWAERFLVIDSSGSDWQQLLPGKTVTVVQGSPSVTDFAAVRNTALDHCSSDWIFFVDSDEIVSSGAQLEVVRVIQSTASGGVVTRSDVFQSQVLQHGEAGNQPLIRLCKVADCRFAGTVHEVAQIKGSLLHTSIRLEHQAHTSVSEFIESVDRYAAVAAREERIVQLSLWQLLLQALCYPPLKFIQNYLLRGGFNDGFAGIVYAFCMSLHSLLVRVYACENKRAATIQK